MLFLIKDGRFFHQIMKQIIASSRKIIFVNKKWRTMGEQIVKYLHRNLSWNSKKLIKIFP